MEKKLLTGLVAMIALTSILFVADALKEETTGVFGDKALTVTSTTVTPTDVTPTDVTPDQKPRKLGDVDGDGEITPEDARLALRAAVQLEKFAPGSPAFLAADVNGCGKIEPEDARLILRAAVKLITLG